MTTLPRGLHAQELRPLNQTKFLDTSLRNELWLLGSYSKKIGYPVQEQYPVQLSSTGKFFNDTGLHRFINQQSYVFLSADTTGLSQTSFDSSYIAVTAFGPGYMKVLVNNPGLSLYLHFFKMIIPGGRHSLMVRRSYTSRAIKHLSLYPCAEGIKK
jgi:hypothetical protein